MDGQTVQALIDALKKCDKEKLILYRIHDLIDHRDILTETCEVEETPENVYLDID